MLDLYKTGVNFVKNNNNIYTQPIFKAEDSKAITINELEYKKRWITNVSQLCPINIHGIISLPIFRPLRDIH